MGTPSLRSESCKNQRCERLWIAAVVVIVLAHFTVCATAQERGRLPDPNDSLHGPTLTFGTQGPGEPEGLPDDWSHHHLVFSNPGTEEDAIRKGTYDDWLRIVNDPRYVMQRLKRRSPVQGPAAEYVTRMNEMARAHEAAVAGDLAAPQSRGPGGPVLLNSASQRKATIHRDWSAALLTGDVLPNTFAAKWSFDTTGTPDCTNDFVVYPTGSNGSGTAATIIAYNNLYATTCSGTVPSVYWAYNTGAATVTNSPTISGDGTQVAFIQVRGTAAELVLVKPQPTIAADASITATLTGGSTAFTVTTGTVSQSDVGLQITGGTHLPAHDTIAAVTSSTTGTLTTAATGTGGTQYAGQALTIHAETVALPGVPPLAASAAAYQSCTAPCMYSITLSGSPNNTYSSPFYDYADDALYVGDNISKLHQFTGVFNGTPTESGGSWPATLSAATRGVSSPVYDPNSGCVFVGDTYGYLYSVNVGATVGVCTGTSGTVYSTSENLGHSATGDGIYDGPLVDSTAGMVYVFVTSAKGTIGNCSTARGNCVYQFSTAMTGASAVPNNEEPLGTGGTNYRLFGGAFDNLYYSSSDPASPSGNIYVVGNTGATNGTGTLYQVPISSNVLGTPVTVSASLNGGDSVWASPVTEFCNNGPSACVVNSSDTQTTGGTDYIFFSVNRGNVGGTCNNAAPYGCVLAYDVSNPLSIPTPPSTLNITATASPGCWTTGGFIIDNASSSPGASQVYFINLNGNSPTAKPGTCGTTVATQTIDATQASQSGLQ